MNIRQAITTKYLGHTNYRGTRIKASCSRGSLTVSGDASLNLAENHIKAAVELIKSFMDNDHENYRSEGGAWVNNPWNHPFVTGVTGPGAYVHVLIEDGKLFQSRPEAAI